VLGILISLQAQFVRPEYFPEGIFIISAMARPRDPILAAWVFLGTMGTADRAQNSWLTCCCLPSPEIEDASVVVLWSFAGILIEDILVRTDRAPS